ncbi:hypothetical protein NM688_g2617 [Phlebia brevispora]|uniref:Uncharacterized protein n=1 Tax=Phlebia brevispora TaxID=194682 RepID=A0ACC1T8B5_9APHY|nr:hypothetical protein NM688_g2617 [Phlebia brevispora]
MLTQSVFISPGCSRVQRTNGYELHYRPLLNSARSQATLSRNPIVRRFFRVYWNTRFPKECSPVTPAPGNAQHSDCVDGAVVPAAAQSSFSPDVRASEHSLTQLHNAEVRITALDEKGVATRILTLFKMSTRDEAIFSHMLTQCTGSRVSGDTPVLTSTENAVRSLLFIGTLPVSAMSCLFARAIVPYDPAADDHFGAGSCRPDMACDGIFVVDSVKVYMPVKKVYEGPVAYAGQISAISITPNRVWLISGSGIRSILRVLATQTWSKGSLSQGWIDLAVDSKPSKMVHELDEVVQVLKELP